MSEKAKVTVVGSGYVGMSLAVLLAQHNDVVVLDIDPERVDQVNRRESTVANPDIEAFLKEKDLSLSATLDADLAYSGADFVVVATPTNYDPDTNQFDTRAVDSVVKQATELANEALAQMSTVKRGLVVKSYSTAMTYYYIRAKIVAIVDHLKESGEVSERVADRIEHDLKPIPRGTFYDQDREFDVPRVCKMLCKKQRRVVPYFSFDELKFRKTKRSSFTNPIKSLEVLSVGENSMNTPLLKPRHENSIN